MAAANVDEATTPGKSGNARRNGAECETETDRYISWPGQALAYKTGELTIRSLRERAEQALGRRFDIREFHDRILAGGTVTMPILESRIDRWIRSKS